ncbi:MAG: ankyrin repeat domain-containing protein, partial [Candidatus Thorarchaeota archaeon]
MGYLPDMSITRAIIIGISKYHEEKDILPFARPSAEKLVDVLEEHYAFDDIKFVPEKDCTLDGIRDSLRSLESLSKDDAVLIAFSGHAKQMGAHWYFLLQEASLKDSDYTKFFRAYELFAEYMDNVEVGHIFLIVDACYGGLLAYKGGSSIEETLDDDYTSFRGIQINRISGDDNPVIKELMSPEKPSRFVLAAGDASEPVPDGGGDNISLFMEVLCDYLTCYSGDILPAITLASEVRTAVLERLSRSPLKHRPTFNFISRNKGGIFCFLRKGVKRPSTELPFSPETNLRQLPSIRLGEAEAMEQGMKVAKEVNELLNSDNYEGLIDRLSVMVDYIKEYPKNLFFFAFLSGALRNILFVIAKIKYVDGVSCILDILRDVASHHYMQIQIQRDLAKCIADTMEFLGDSYYSEQKKKYVLNLRRLVLRFPNDGEILESWNKARLSANTKQVANPSNMGHISVSEDFLHDLHTLRRSLSCCLPIHGGAWTAEEIEKLAVFFLTNKDLKKLPFVKSELERLSNMLERAFMDSVKQCFGNSSGEIDVSQMQVCSLRSEFISNLVSHVQTVCSDVFHHEFRIGLLTETIDSSFQENLESEIISEKGYSFSEAAYWKIIRELTDETILSFFDSDLAASAGAWHGSGDVVTLVSKGADPNVRTYDGKPALIRATEHRNNEMVEVLLQSGADIAAVDIDGNTPLICAAALGANEIIRTLLDKSSDVNAKSMSGKTALMAAAAEGNTETMEILLAAGAEIDAHDLDNQTAFLWAYKGGHTKTIETLASSGANINPKYDNTELALLGAIKGGYRKIVEMLLEVGADVNKPNEDGWTALMMA